MKNFDAKYWIQKLCLVGHPEGGYFRETYRSEMRIAAVTSGHITGERNISTAIYFLLEKSQCSAFHRIASDEIWHFHTGDSMLIHVIDAEGRLHSKRIGPQSEMGDDFQVVIPAGAWFAAEVINKQSFCLCGCTVSPGFDFADFELATPRELSAAYPQHSDLIFRMSH